MIMSKAEDIRCGKVAELFGSFLEQILNFSLEEAERMAIEETKAEAN